MVLLNDYFREGTIMKSALTKYSGLRFLMILAFIVAACAVAAAENDNENPEKDVAETVKDDQREIEVLTTLEQRMQERITIDASDLPIDTVIRQLAEQADVDLIKSPQVIGNVTATLTDVPLEEALKNILRAHGFDYVTDKNMIRIVPVGDIIEAEERLVSKIYRITYADVAGVEKALGKFVSKRGTVSLNKGTSHIIVTDTESNIKAIDKFVEEIDQITSQVLVEVRIYDIKTQDTLDLGIQWEAGRVTDYSAGALGFDPDGHVFPFMSGTFRGPTSKTADSTIGALRFGWLDSAIDIDALISAEQENINAKLLANPRILVLDNETALFDIITQHPYVERTISGETITETIKYKDVGTKLQVTPHVTRDGMLRLHIMPEFGVKVRDVALSSGDVPVIDTRSIDTIALVEHGQTVVLGGLRKKEVTQQTNKVPLLGDLPLIGALFRFEGEDTTNSEIVVFITPRIITRAALSEDEQQAYKATEFSRPEPVITKAEAEASKNNE
jgi:type IV pilus assembly protein PilQ